MERQTRYLRLNLWLQQLMHDQAQNSLVRCGRTDERMLLACFWCLIAGEVGPHQSSRAPHLLSSCFWCPIAGEVGPHQSSVLACYSWRTPCLARAPRRCDVSGALNEIIIF
jgi:hypothetical protein